MHVKILHKKMNLLKMFDPQVRLCLFMFRPIASTRLNSLTTTTLSLLDGAEVTHPLWVRDVPDLLPGSGNGFYVCSFVLFLVFCHQAISIHFAMLIYLVYLTFCKMYDRL